MGKKVTPAQQQYLDLKRKYADCILLFRMGDFYEMFYEDAKIAHKVLHITLTSRDKSSDNPIPMAGVPHHALERYLPKLIEAGYKVALAEQIGDVQPGKVVERDVVQVVTPGTYVGDTNEWQYLIAITYGGKVDPYHIARGDYAVGKYFTQSFPSLEECQKRISLLRGKEFILDADFPETEAMKQFVQQQQNRTLTILDAPFDTETYLQGVLKTSSLEGYGKALQERRMHALSLLFSYIEQTQQTSLQSISTVSYAGESGLVHIDEITFKNLEVFQSSYEGSSKQSLFHVINCCQTAMGSRLLQNRLQFPITSKYSLVERLQRIGYFRNEITRSERLRHLLADLPDIPRLLNKILYASPSAQRCIALRDALEVIFMGETGELCGEELAKVDGLKERLVTLRDLYDDLQRRFVATDDLTDEVYIHECFDEEVDRCSQLAFHSDADLLKYQKQLLDHVGVSSLKIRYISNQGYLIEVAKRDTKHLEAKALPDQQEFDFVRRQTLKSVERYMTTYMDELQQRILHAREQLAQRQAVLLQEAIQKIQESFLDLSLLSDSLAEIDIATSMADFSIKHDWCEPELSEDYEITIQEGKHPVVEAFLPTTESFIPNNLDLSQKQNFHLITGPNMGGKSTYLRQNALIVLLAHAGLYVPARQAQISIVDGIFARVGSGDILAKNQSTFMTEMLEMANILHNATARSFVVLDELGRGTSTYDGLSLAKSICVYISKKLGCKTLFATHYHELIHLEKELPGFHNVSVSVYETDKRVVFLKKIVDGGANKSYGLDVAKLAGIPQEVVDSALHYLKELEVNKKGGVIPQQTGFDFGVGSEMSQKLEEIQERFEQIAVNGMTPLEALNELERLREYVLSK